MGRLKKEYEGARSGIAEGEFKTIGGCVGREKRSVLLTGELAYFGGDEEKSSGGVWGKNDYRI